VTATQRRWEVVATVVTAVLVAGLLLWGADRLARSSAESLVTQELQRLTGAPRPPLVELRGSSFLLQALTGRYDGVDVTLRGLSSGPLRIERLEARLTGVHLPFSELVRRNPSVVGVESASAGAVLTYADLDRYLDFTGRPYAVRPGAGPQQLEISGEVQVLGRDLEVTATAVLGAESGALTVTPVSVDVGQELGRPAEILLRQRLTFLVPLDPLPFGQQVIGVSAEDGGVVIRTAVDGVALRPR
jgi:LmeA-like phospholipid-binding